MGRASLKTICRICVNKVVIRVYKEIRNDELERRAARFDKDCDELVLV